MMRDTPRVGGSSADRLRSLATLGRALARAQTVDEAAEVAVADARFAFNAAATAVARLDRASGRLRLLALAGPRTLDQEPSAHPYPQGLPQVTVPLIAQAIDEVRSLALDVDSTDVDATSREWVDGIGYSRALVAPLWLVSEVWGLVVMVRDASGPAFDDKDVGFADAYAGIVSAGLVQAGHAEEMAELAFRDPLTGLANRRAFDRALADALERHARDETPVTVLIGDVDRLKRANDSYGHPAGDEALRAVADAVSAAVGVVPQGFAARTGGDEFAAVLPTSLVAATSVAEDLAARSRHAPYGVGLSIGLAGTDRLPHGWPANTHELYEWADAACLTAKRNGNGLPVVATLSALGARPPEYAGERDLSGADLVGSCLQVLAETPGHPGERLVRLARRAAHLLLADGFVVSRIEGGTAHVHAAVGSGGMPLGLADLDLRQAGWLDQARRSGLVARAGDAEIDLPDRRDSPQVLAAVSQDWLLELLGGSQTRFGGAAGLVRALVSVAVNG
jgi:diguanylate cyclase (GGDEF)-like protein